MGILSLFSKPSPAITTLPSGSVTLDRNGRILASTVSSSCPDEVLEEVAAQVLRLFNEARRAQMPLSELVFNFASLQITARELRGGALIFLKPKH
jgi:hypothetical protein